MALGRKTGGRQPGSVNRVTASVKAALEEAFDTSGGIDALVAWARENRTEFYKLYARLLPIDVKADFKHRGAVTIMVDTGITRAPDEVSPC